MAYAICPHFNNNYCKVFDTYQDGEYQKKEYCLSRRNWVRCANFRPSNVICPHFDWYGNRCKIVDGHPSDSGIENNCLSSDNWTRCPNFENRIR